MKNIVGFVGSKKTETTNNRKNIFNTGKNSIKLQQAYRTDITYQSPVHSVSPSLLDPEHCIEK